MSNGFVIRSSRQAEAGPTDGTIHRLSMDKRHWQISHVSHGRFAQDQCFELDDRYLIAFEGISLTTTSRIELVELLRAALEMDRPFGQMASDIADKIKGVYMICLIDLHLEKLLVMADPCGSLPLFYDAFVDTDVSISPRIEDLVHFRSREAKSSSLDEQAAYSMLTMGAMLGNQTMVTEIKRLHACEYLLWEHGKWTVSKYFDYRDIAYKDQSKEEVFDRLDDLLGTSVQMALHKDRQYDFDSLMTLSGGLDSRYVVMQAHKLGAVPSTFCMSQSGYKDHAISKQIASDLGLGYTFCPLDGGDYIHDVEENMDLYQGQIFYLTSAHLRRAMTYLDTSQMGLLHSGLLGDGRLGSQVSAAHPRAPWSFHRQAIDTSLWHRVEQQVNQIYQAYPHEDACNFVERSCNQYISGAWMTAQSSYLWAPFMDFDFIRYSFTIPPRLKLRRRIYVEWLAARHPEMCEYKWEAYGVKPKSYARIQAGRFYRLSKALLRRIAPRSEGSMTPFACWAERDPSILEFMRNYIQERLQAIESSELKSDLVAQSASSSIMVLSQVMTVMSMISKFQLRS